MENLNLSKIKKVFFIGIGGIGISAIARLMFLEGREVSGSDMSENELTRELSELGIKITIGQSFELIPKDTDLIIYTIAIAHYDPKLFEQIKNSGFLYKSYPQMLHYLTENKYTIAVSGTHGKTTTTAMIGKILIDAKKDPSIIVGSLLKEYKSNLVVGRGEYFVVEACEYERSFLNINPTVLVVTNIEADHLDYYKDIEDIKNAFNQLIHQTKSVVVYDAQDMNISVLVREYEKRNENKIKFIDYFQYLAKIPKLLVPGEHNRMDAAAALAVAEVLGIKEDGARKSLKGFSGTWRRLEKKGTIKEGVIIYDDYAHHPTEIKASLQGLRELYPPPCSTAEAIGGTRSSETSASQSKPSSPKATTSQRKITVLFQPHLYSRTKALFDDFAKSFKDADRVLLLPIYFAREAPDPSISSEKLAVAICASALTGEKEQNVQAFPDFESAENYIRTLNLGKNDVFVTMGAGEAYKVAEKVFPIH